MRNDFLAVDSVSVSFGKGAAKICALRNASLALAPGTLSLVMGPSGSGKTTLLSLLGCLLSPDQGQVFVDGVPVHHLQEQEKTALRRRKISFVFQAFRLMHSLSAIDNVALALEVNEIALPTLGATGCPQPVSCGPGPRGTGCGQPVAPRDPSARGVSTAHNSQ